MQLQTTFPISPILPLISYDAPIVSVGSCFSTVIGQKLQKHKFEVLNNPFGTIFNPISIFELIKKSIHREALSSQWLIQQEDRYLHYELHSDITADSQEGFMKLFQEQQNKTASILARASHLILTFGTSHVYRIKASQKLVANCHKQPSQLFEKELLELPLILEAFEQIIPSIKIINPSLNIIVTVSPVRHIKDGIPENQLSKSLLRVACHQLEQNFPNVHYFPSYEIMMDELRDYRYYKEDMIHPTEQAENYIWEKFTACSFSEETLHKVDKIAKIQKSLEHKAFNPKGKSHRQFLINLLQKMEQFSGEIDFSVEIREVQKRLLSF
ncbi:GSCFA domain-containing protein [Echinicola jeungdonensis]|uniref:GSCFA domain-containing protein n=1 Tax=Echinicola jeungdonensis TaxID=709343 RepID=A0ABV5J939_9BACT|nr:GSCFA domain-containing protein [Echinicola jeungdonensis]MDN3670143.1 GSCFA domain-containing protein [Echinicola jeungdonensis]